MRKYRNKIFLVVAALIIFANIVNTPAQEEVKEEKKQEQQEEQKEESKITEDHIKVLEADTTYEDMTSSERTDAVEVTECYWDELSKEQQEKYAKRKEFILKTKEEAVAKWAAEEEEEEAEEEKVEYTSKPAHNVTKVKFGTLLNVNVSDKLMVVKAKITPSYSNKATVHQNGYNVEDIINNQGGDAFDEIQYWAVADMTSGSESKVISFTLTKQMIDAIKNGRLLGNQIVDYASDVWILPSLQY